VAMKIPRAYALRLLFFIGLGFVAAEARESAEELIKAGLDKACAGYASIVTASEGNFGSVSPNDCLGAFQFCPGTFELYFHGTPQQFLADPHAQVVAFTAYEQTQWKLAQKNKLTDLIGETVKFDGKSATIDASAILMACQFGCGKPPGRLASYLADHNRDCNSQKVKDGNGTSVCTYLIRGAGQNVSCFTGGPVVGGGPAGSGGGSSGSDGGHSGSTGGSTECGPAGQFGAEGPLEIAVGRFTLRFSSAADADTIKKYLAILDQASR
jgi:hypothetical protein